MRRESSQTALISAAHREVHQDLDGGRILNDPLAPRILGPRAQVFLDQARSDPARLYWMVNFNGRSRFAEEKTAAAIAKGVTQVVVLGAGYDTFCYRVQGPDELRLFEVDHPLTQGEKRSRLDAADIEAPKRLAFVAVDFEREDAGEKLQAAGFDPGRPSFFIWLGVIYYLSEEAVFKTLAMLSDLPGGVEVAFDYINKRAENISPEAKAASEAMLKRTAEYGEPTRNFIETDDMSQALRRLGFAEIVDLAHAKSFRALRAVCRRPSIPRGAGISSMRGNRIASRPAFARRCRASAVRRG
jgi:methyltransferase (TIGR00027 family)